MIDYLFPEIITKKEKKLIVGLTISAFLTIILFLISVFTARAEGPTPQISVVGAVPNSGMLVPGDTLSVFFTEANSKDDLELAQSCLVNETNVNSTFENLTDGLYKVTYTVGTHDPQRAAGEIPIHCAFNDSSGSVTSVFAFTDSNTVGVGIQSGDNDPDGNPGDGNNGDNGDGGNGGTTGTTTSDINISEVGTVPNSGTLSAPHDLDVFFREASGNTTLTLKNTCTVNEKDVSSTFQNLTDGLYKVTYTIASTDSDRGEGLVPLNCTLGNSATSTITVTAFTDGNTVAIDAAGDGMSSSTPPNNGTSTPPTNGTSTPPTNGTTTPPTNGTSTPPTNNNSTSTSQYNSTTTDGTINGEVNGGQSRTNGVLRIDSIEPIQTTATADGTYQHGWSWRFNITVPSNEPSLRFKFGNWFHTNGADSIPVANNMRVTLLDGVASSTQSNASSTITISAPDTYSNPLMIAGDMDENTNGRQIRALVEMAIPSNSFNGSYTASYGIKSTP